jgi:cytochrome c
MKQGKEEQMEGYLRELALVDARGWVNEAIAFYKATSREIALAEFSNPQGRFVQGEKYLYVLDINGTMLAHGVNERYPGKDFYRVQDSEGKSFIKEIVDTANLKSYGWAEYKWMDPVTKSEQPKTVYFERVDNMIFCSGVYGSNLVYSHPEDPLAEIVGDEVSVEQIIPSVKPASAAVEKGLSEEGFTELLPDDAKRWVEKAITFYKANGKDIALAECSTPLGRFVGDGQYLYVLDINGTMLAHPINAKFIGKDFYRIEDVDGKSFIKEIVDNANIKGCGWAEYKWFNPATKRLQPKTVYFEKVDGMIFCSGVYLF